MLRKYIFIIIIVTCFALCDIISAAGYNCYLNKSEDVLAKGIIVYHVNDISTGQIDKIQTKNIAKVELESKYVTSEYKNDLLTFTLTDEFKHYTENEDKLIVDSKLAFTCTEGSKPIILELNVVETIHHGPKFKLPEYRYKLPMPLLPNRVIDGTEMIATVLDITKRRIQFQVTGDYGELFDFTKTSKTDEDYRASLSTKKIVDLKDTAIFTVTVTDLDDTSKVDKATVTIQVDSNNSVIPNPEFANPYYRTQYKVEQEIIDLDIVLVNKNYKATVEIIEEYTEYFKTSQDKDGKILINKIKDLPDSITDQNHYIILTIQATYKKADRPGETVVLMDMPEKGRTTTTVAPKTTTTQPTTSQKTTITTTRKTTTIVPKPDVHYDNKDKNKMYTKSSHSFGYIDTIQAHTSDKHKINYEIKDINGGDIWNNVVYNSDGRFFIVQTINPGTYKIKIRAWIGQSEDTAMITLTITKSSVKYHNDIKEITKNSDYTGLLAPIVATTDENEQIQYEITKINGGDVRKNLLYTEEGKLYAILTIPTGVYQITLKASIKDDSDTTEIKLTIINNPGSFDYGLVIKNVDENDEKLIVPSEENDKKLKLNIIDKYPEDSDWFEIDAKGLWVKNVDREDPRIASMHLSQINATIEYIHSNYYSNQSLFLSEDPDLDPNLDPNPDPYGTCIYTSSLKNNLARMRVIVIINDLNDNDPVLQINARPFYIGYPSKDLIDYIAPPYLAQITATDKDIGLNALIRYKVDSSKFVVDPHTGVIAPGEGAFKDDKDDEFLYTAQDRDGAGRTDKANIKVKILKVEHLLELKIKNLTYPNINKYINDLSKKIKKQVRYLTSAALTNDLKKQDKKVIEEEENGSILKLILYAFDNENELLKAKDFKNLITDSKSVINVKEYERPNSDYNFSGWIAAVSVLSALVLILCISAILVYFFVLRPKMINFNGYVKHKERDSLQLPPIKAKIESTSTTRRATGFPLEFSPDSLTFTDAVNSDVTEMIRDNDEGLPESQSVSSNEADGRKSSEEPERRKSVVTFNNNVTEIEIEDSYL